MVTTNKNGLTMTDIPEPIFIEQTTSTNTFLAQLCSRSRPAELASVYTSCQTAGRGQRGNSWESEPGKNLLFSFVAYPTFLEAGRQFLLSQVAALGVAETLSVYTEGIRIKWPNDIYWKDRKLCGTLIENDLDGTCVSRSIIGTGINLNQLHFADNAPNAVSLAQITGERYEPTDILRRVMQRTAWYYGQLKEGKDEYIRQRYKAALYRRDGFHAYRDGEGRFLARIRDIRPSGRLVLEDASGTLREYMFKEVSFEL